MPDAAGAASSDVAADDAGSGAGPGGEVISTGVSSSPKMRSDDAIADCRMLNFSDRSLMGLKKRWEYCRHATSTPSSMVSCTARPPPYQMMSAVATAPSTSMAG